MIERLTDLDDADMDRLARAIRGATRRVSTVSRGLLEQGDISQHLYEWAAAHPGKVAEYLGDSQRGAGKLQVTLERQGMLAVSRERRQRTGDPRGECILWYTEAMLEELLPDVWYYSTWATAGGLDETEKRRTVKPAEGNNRLAALVDVAGAVARLTAEDRAFLRLRWADGGNTWEEVALFYEVTAEAVRKRHKRVLQKMLDRLGGQAPWWTPARHARSNASTQAELRQREA